MLMSFNNFVATLKFTGYEEDIVSSKMLKDQLSTLGVKLIDHFIVGNNQIYSIFNASFVKED